MLEGLLRAIDPIFNPSFDRILLNIRLAIKR